MWARARHRRWHFAIPKTTNLVGRASHAQHIRIPAVPGHGPSGFTSGPVRLPECRGLARNGRGIGIWQADRATLMLNKFGHRMWVVFQARPDNRRNSCPYARCPWRLRAAGLPTLRRPSRAPAAGKVNRSRQAQSRSSGPPQPRDVHAKIPGTAAGVVHQHSPRWPGTQPIPRHQDGRTARSAPEQPEQPPGVA